MVEPGGGLPHSPLAPVVAAVALVGVELAAALRPLTTSAGSSLWGRLRESSLDGKLDNGLGEAAGGMGVLAGPLRAIAVGGLLILVVLLARQLVRQLRPRRGKRAGLPNLSGAGGRVRHGAGDAVYEDALAEAARLGAKEIAAATRRQSSPWDVSDAVVASWVRLESVAAGAGARRLAPQTAGEFASDLLRRRLVSAEPTQDLLALYCRARFSQEQLSAVDGHRAESALSSLHRELVGVAA